MRIKVKSFPDDTGIITLADAKEQLSIPSTYSGLDDKVNAMLYASSNDIAKKTGRYIIEQSLECIADSWEEIEGEGILPYGYFQSVTSLKYLDEDNNSQTVSTDDYFVGGVETDDGYIKFQDTFTAPALYEFEPITLEIVIGYESDTGPPIDYQANIPDAIQTACKLQVEEISDGVENAEVITNLLYSYKSWRI